MVAFKKSTSDTRFVAKIAEVSAWSDTNSYNDIGGAGQTLDFIQVTSDTSDTKIFELLLNIYNTADVTVGTTAPVLRLPLQKVASEEWSCVMPGGVYLDTAVSFSITERDATAPSHAVTVRIVYH